MISYADLYDSANFEAKKMIVSQLIRRVDVYRRYKSMWTSTLILHSIWRIAMNLLADKHKNTVDFDLKSTVFVTLI